MNMDDMAALAVLVTLVSAPYLVVIGLRRWWWTLLPAISVAVALAVMLMAMGFGWLPRGDKGLGMLLLIFLLWPLIVGIGVRCILGAGSMFASLRGPRLLVECAGWGVALMVLTLV